MKYENNYQHIAEPTRRKILNLLDTTASDDIVLYYVGVIGHGVAKITRMTGEIDTRCFRRKSDGNFEIYDHNREYRDSAKRRSIVLQFVIFGIHDVELISRILCVKAKPTQTIYNSCLKIITSLRKIVHQLTDEGMTQDNIETMLSLPQSSIQGIVNRIKRKAL